jgi:hypothetical protein
MDFGDCPRDFRIAGAAGHRAAARLRGELLRVKHRIDAQTDPEKGRLETMAWIKRLRDMRRVAEKKAPGVFLPPPPQDFVGRTEALEMLYAALGEEPGGALLHGEPGCGKSMLALKFAWQTQGAFDAVVFQLCGQRPVAAIAAELAAKLKLGLETKPPEEQIAVAKAWLAERRALLVLDDIWGNDVTALAPGPPVSLLCTPTFAAVDFADLFAGVAQSGTIWLAPRDQMAICTIITIERTYEYRYQ